MSVIRKILAENIKLLYASLIILMLPAFILLTKIVYECGVIFGTYVQQIINGMC